MQTSRAIAQPPAAPESVWVVDDDQTALLLAQSILEKAGFVVQTFSSASDALALARATLPDIIVVDVMMPRMNGFEFCASLRALPGGASVPLLMATSLDDPDSIHRAYEAGATDFTSKPLNWAFEIHRLRYMLRSASMARQLQLREQETRLAKDDWEQTFNSIPDAVTVLGSGGMILRSNKAASALFSRTHPSLIGQNCCQLFHDHAPSSPGCPISAAQHSNRPASAEIDSPALGRSFEVVVSPITDPSGRVTRLVHVARDLTGRKQLEANLRQAQKMEAIGTLAGGIAHDFNNLLTVIKGNAEMLLTGGPAPGSPAEEARDILQAASRGASLARQLLIFSRKGGADTRRQHVDIQAAVQSLLKMLVHVLPKSVALAPRFAPDLLPAWAAPSQIEQVLMNLAINAAHAMPGGGVLSIEASNARLDGAFCQDHPKLQPGDYVVLSVSDTGCGMDKATLERIYEPFFTTKQPGQGTGLGLSVVFGIVQEHEGHITCQSQPGAGTVFRVYLPAVPAASEPAAPAASAQPRQPRGSGTILLADDEPAICSLIESYLAASGYTTLSAASGQAAFALYSTTIPRPQAVVLDLGMANGSGWDCLEELRQFDPRARVLVATGYALDSVEERALALGAAGFLRKPFSLEALSAKLRQILQA